MEVILSTINYFPGVTMINSKNDTETLKANTIGVDSPHIVFIQTCNQSLLHNITCLWLRRM